MSNRRRFIQSMSALPLAANVSVAAPTKRDYFKELAVRTFINAAGTYTTLTASLMHPDAMQAIDYAAQRFVHLEELHNAVGKKLASLLQAESAMVTSGAAAALTLGTAACMTGADPAKILRLPDTTDMKTEVLMQKSHRYGYDRAIRNCGVKVVEVETAQEFERAAGSNTALALFFNANEPAGKIKAEEFAALGKKLNVPTFNDAAADVPPVENLYRFQKMGFDLVTFSGGKGIRGPQSAGLLYGRKDLIAAARMNSSPNGNAIGRGMKVNKEEILGMMVALESFINRDHKAEWKEWEKRVGIVADGVTSVKGIKTETFIPEIANAVPHLRISWDEAALKISADDVVKKLREGDPSIELRPGSGNGHLDVAVWMLQPGEAQIVAKRIREVLKSS